MGNAFSLSNALTGISMFEGVPSSTLTTSLLLIHHPQLVGPGRTSRFLRVDRFAFVWLLVLGMIRSRRVTRATLIPRLNCVACQQTRAKASQVLALQYQFAP